MKLFLIDFDALITNLAAKISYHVKFLKYSKNLKMQKIPSYHAYHRVSTAMAFDKVDLLITF